MVFPADAPTTGKVEKRAWPQERGGVVILVFPGMLGITGMEKRWDSVSCRIFFSSRGTGGFLYIGGQSEYP